jgi:hypothetical protein
MSHQEDRKDWRVKAKAKGKKVKRSKVKLKGE